MPPQSTRTMLIPSCGRADVPYLAKGDGVSIVPASSCGGGKGSDPLAFRRERKYRRRWGVDEDQRVRNRDLVG